VSRHLARGSRSCVNRAFLAPLIFAVFLAANSLPAQELPSTKSPSDTGTSGLERNIRKLGELLKKPVHPTLKGVGPGGGIGVGIEYDSPYSGPWKTSASAVVTLRRYWSAEVVTGYYTRLGEAEAFGRMRHMSRLDFYGLGTNSDVDARTDFRLRDPVVGGRGRVRLNEWLAVAARVEEMWPDVGRGKSSAVPSIEQRFGELTAPGLTEQPRFGRYEGAIDIHVPPGVGEALYQGTKARVTYAIYSDQELDRFSFHRTDIEAQQRFALVAPHHRLTLSGWVSVSEPKSGNVVPFYLMRTLGGTSEVRSVHDNRLGSDGTDATLRGFRNLRFRDRNLLLLQAEYRVPIWGPFDASVFADAGKVTRERDDLDLSDLKHDFGFSLSLMKEATTALRIDLGMGGGEGVRVFFTLGDVVP
jgi:hypothetical protein